MRLFQASLCLAVAASAISCSSSVAPILPTSSVSPSSAPREPAPTPTTSVLPTILPPGAPTSLPTPSGINPTWVQIPTTGGITPHWSPDGSYLVLEEQDVYGLVLLNAAGQHIGSYAGYLEPTWLTDDEFVAYKQSSMPSNPHREIDAPATIVNATDGTTRDVSFPCCDAVGNGHGAAAVSWFLPYLHGVPQPQFSVWSNGTVTDPQPGFPIVWSLAGDTLVVAHPYEQGHSTDGWMEAFGWPGLTTIMQGHGTTQAALTARFSPSGSYLTPASTVNPSNPPSYLGVLALATADVAAIPTAGNDTSFAWDAQDDVLVSDDTGLATYSPDGTKLGHEPFSGWITGSADGSTVLLLDSNNVMTAWPIGDVISLPTLPESETTFWLSPTGESLFVISNGGPWLAQLP